MVPHIFQFFPLYDEISNILKKQKYHIFYNFFMKYRKFSVKTHGFVQNYGRNNVFLKKLMHEYQSF